MDTHSKLLALLASAALGLGLAGCAGNADASAPVPQVPTIADMDREKQVLNAERDKKIARDYAAKVKAEKEAKAKAEAEAAAQAQAQAQTQAQAGSGAVNRSGAVAKRSYQQGARSNGAVKARKGKATTRSGSGGGDELSPEVLRRRTIELDRIEKEKYRNAPRRDTSKVIVCVSGNCGN